MRARVWLLPAKVVAVGCYVGGLGATGVVWVSSGFASLSPSDPRRLWTIDAVRNLSLFFTVPALLCAMALGIALYFRNPRHLIRTRWLRVKFVSLVALIPAAHFTLSSRIAALRAAYYAGGNDVAAS
jgi:uncharacterized membrane protein